MLSENEIDQKKNQISVDDDYLFKEFANDNNN